MGPIHIPDPMEGELKEDHPKPKTNLRLGRDRVPSRPDNNAAIVASTALNSVPKPGAREDTTNLSPRDETDKKSLPAIPAKGNFVMFTKRPRIYCELTRAR